MDATRQRFLMCRPTYFAVDYAINPWMDPTAPVDADLAIRQWERLRQTYLDRATPSSWSTRSPACRTWSSPPTAAR